MACAAVRPSWRRRLRESGVVRAGALHGRLGATPPPSGAATSLDRVALPRIPAPFAWDGDHLAITLPGAQARFTTRRGGVSAGPYASLNLGPWTDDDPAAVATNHERLRASLGLDALSVGRQVHEADVVDAAAPREAAADGRVTREPGVGVLVLTADCLPVALSGPAGVAMVHAGWRGLAAGVLEAGIAALGDDVRAAAIGPGAGGCCYETGPEVHAAFGRTAVAPAPLDLKAIARERLAAAGVPEVHDAGLCTICGDPALFFSHRRDAGVTGRQGGVAWRS